MELSVLIPTHRRPGAAERCLAGLLEEALSTPCEIILGLDGDASQTPEPSIPPALAARTRTLRLGRVGLPRLRQAMMHEARGRIVLWLNDDAVPCPGLLGAHLSRHASVPDPIVVAGRAEWGRVERPTLFDRLVQGSDLVFFRQGGEPGESDYRNCFGLNMSFSRELAERVGGVARVQEHYGYEDIELAWRLARGGARCVYEPGARVIHEHRYTPEDVHRREYLLGRAAWAFAEHNPAFIRELLGFDPRAQDALDAFATLIAWSWRDALRIERSFLALADRDPGQADASLLPVLAEHWVPLKRLLWRWGVLDASRSIPARWSLLRDTSPESVLNAIPGAV